MSPASKEDEKIINENFDLIQLVVTAINIDSYIAVLNNNLDIAEKNGWTNLVSAIRKIISGKKEKVVLDDLDYEDQVISSKILSLIESPDAMAKLLLQQAVQQYNRGNIQQAEVMCKKAVELNPQYFEANAQSGFILQAQKKYKEAKIFYTKALEIKPNQARIHLNLGIIFQDEKDFDSASSSFQAAMDIDDNLLPAIEHLAYLYEKAYRLNEAQLLVQKGLTLDPSNPALNLVQSKLLQRNGQLENALESLKIAAKSNKILSLHGEIQSRLGYIYDRLNQPQQAYHHYSMGNQFSEKVFQQQRINKEQYLKQIEHIANIAEKIEPVQINEIAEEKVENPPVFLVGFPRSGTTLMNQILDSHPGLQTLEEKPQTFNTVTRFLELTDDMQNPLADINQKDLDELRTLYFDTVEKYIQRNHNTIFIDKFPLNIAYVPIVWRIFPNARFILALRHPCDATLSCFMHSFGVNPAMANFLSMKSTVELYVKLMHNWKLFLQKFNLDVHIIKYEDLVTDFKNETLKVLRFLGVEWDEEVTMYAEKARARGVIDTPSYDQVTEPIFNHARYRWTRYSKQIEPYMNVLEPYINLFGYTDGSA